MRDSELDRIHRMKGILVDSIHGRGIAGSIVDVFRRSSDSRERDVARRILLGVPIEGATQEILEKEDLLRYIVGEAKVNTLEASRSAEKLSSLFERWARLKERRVTEQRVLEMRSHIISAVLGAVIALLSSLAPVISSFQVSFLSPTPTPTLLPYVGITFALVSSFFLGLFGSRRRAYLDLLISSISYLLASALLAPVVPFSSASA